MTDRIDAGLIGAASPGIKVISQMAVGYDTIDVPATTERGIPVGHTPGVSTDATAILINTAREPIVDPYALRAALQGG